MEPAGMVVVGVRNHEAVEAPDAFGAQVGCQDAAAGILEIVILHHPGWTEIEFVGAEFASAAFDALARQGFQPRATEVGFAIDAPSS